MAYTGSVAIWAMKDGDFISTDFAGTTAGLQAAIGYLAGGKGTVFIGPGTLSITASITVGSNVSLEGCGTATVLQRSGSALAVKVFTDNGTAPSNVNIRGFTFDNNSLAVSVGDISFSQGVSNLSITKCRWINLTNRVSALIVVSGGSGTHNRYINISENTVVGGTTTDTYNSFQVLCASDVTISSNFIDGWGAIKIEQTTDSLSVMRRIGVHNNRFLNVDQTHVFVRTGGATEIEDVSLTGNTASMTAMTVLKGLFNVGEMFSGSGGIVRNVTIAGNAGRGHQGYFINLAGVNGTVENCSITGNVFDGRLDGASSIASASESSGVNINSTSKRVSVIGNTFRYTGRSGIRGNGDNVIVANNVLELCAQNDLSAPTPVRESAIYVTYPVNNWTICGNQIINPHNSTLDASYVTGGITLDKDGACDGVDIYGNTIIDDRGGSAGMEHGIKLGVSGAAANPSNVRVWDNRISGSTGNPYIDYGTATTRQWRHMDGLGTAIASAATISVPTDGSIFHITGTTNITNGITVNKWDRGRLVTLIFDDVLTVSDTGTSALDGNFKTASGSTLTLRCDGTNWYEEGRSPQKAAQNSHTGLTAALGSQTLAASPTAGLYAVRGYSVCTTPGDTTAMVVTLAWTDPAASQADGIMTVNLTASNYGESYSVIRVASGNVTYSTSYSGATGTYSLWMTLERVGD